MNLKPLFFAAIFIATLSSCKAAVGDLIINYQANSSGPATELRWSKANSKLWGVDSTGTIKGFNISTGLALSGDTSLIVDSSAGGNGAADSGKPVQFQSNGEITATNTITVNQLLGASHGSGQLQPDNISFYNVGGVSGRFYTLSLPALTGSRFVYLPSQSGTLALTSDLAITLTGDVTGSGTGTFATAIGNSKVTSAMIVDGTITVGDIASSAYSQGGNGNADAGKLAQYQNFGQFNATNALSITSLTGNANVNVSPSGLLFQNVGGTSYYLSITIDALTASRSITFQNKAGAVALLSDITLNQLPQSGATSGQGIVWNGSNWAPGTVGGALTVGTTDIASGTGGRLFYETSGNKLGEITSYSDGTNVQLGGYLMIGRTSNVAWGGGVLGGTTNGYFGAVSAGVFQLQDGAGSGNISLILGTSTSSSGLRLKRSGTTLLVRNGDDSAYGGVSAGTIFSSVLTQNALVFADVSKNLASITLSNELQITGSNTLGVASAGITNAMLAGSIAASKITNTAAVLNADNTFTGVNYTNITTDNTASVVGMQLQTASSASSAGAANQKASPALVLRGSGYNSGAKVNDFKFYTLPISGGGAELHVDFAVNGGAYTNRLALTDTGIFTVGGLVTSGASAGSQAFAASVNTGPGFGRDGNGDLAFWIGGNVRATLTSSSLLKFPSVGLIMFDNGSGTYDTIIGRGAVSGQIRLGASTSGSDAQDQEVKAASATGTNKNGGDLVLSSGDSSGTGTSDIVFKTPKATTSGTTATSAAESARINSTGLTVGKIILWGDPSNAPSGNPPSGFFYMYVDPSTSSLTVKASNGTTTIIGTP